MRPYQLFSIRPLIIFYLSKMVDAEKTYPYDDPDQRASKHYPDSQLHRPGHAKDAPVEAQDGRLGKEEREGVQELRDPEDELVRTQYLLDGVALDVLDVQSQTVV